MSILSQKKKVFGSIAAARTLTEGLPKLKTSSSFPSINNDGNSILFLTDLIKSLVGYEVLVQTVEDTLTHNISDIEREVKEALKVELKSIVSCGINPSLPDFIKSTGTGINFVVSKVDFTDLMHVDPTSDAGKLLYSDITTNLLDSKDFNAFLYETIQNNGTLESWGHTTTSSDILDFKFNSTDINGIRPNNTLTVTANPLYDNKTLTQLNNDYIDSISLFNTQHLLTNIIDSSFGTVSSFVNKTTKQLESEARTNMVIDKIINSDNQDIINSSYFTFTNVERNEQQINAQIRKQGSTFLDTSKRIPSRINISAIQDLNTNIASATNQIDKKIAVSNSLDVMASQAASLSNNQVDNKAIKLNFIQEIVNNFIRAIVNSVLSPKVVTIFLINYKIVYGEDATFTDAVDFLRQNKNLIHNITKTIGNTIIQILLKLALKHISGLVAEAALVQEIDKNKANLEQLLSLIGVPQDTLRKIKGLL